MGGSLSIVIAVHNINKFENMDLSLTACELDKGYYDRAIERIKREVRQASLFQG